VDHAQGGASAGLGRRGVATARWPLAGVATSTRATGAPEPFGASYAASYGAEPAALATTGATWPAT
jgi:hypothetical protein